jgi:hypothetical protein
MTEISSQISKRPKHLLLSEPGSSLHIEPFEDFLAAQEELIDIELRKVTS